MITVPPLRLVLTDKCNGVCCFCHNEGNSGHGEMSIETVESCAKCANDLSLPSIALTGGEPTMRNDLIDIINAIQSINTTSKISLTTNGYQLKKCGERLSSQIEKVNLSFSSFNDDISSQYQGVRADVAIDGLKYFPAKNKTINFIALRENYKELYKLIELCDLYVWDLDILFELNTNADSTMLKDIINDLKNFDSPFVRLRFTPTLTFTRKNGRLINIKHPKISSLLETRLCKDCCQKTMCLERICAIRVYPTRNVSCCLNNFFVKHSGNLDRDIAKAYDSILPNEILIDFLS